MKLIGARKKLTPAEVALDETSAQEIQQFFLNQPRCTCLSSKLETEQRTSEQKHNTKLYLRAYARQFHGNKPKSLRDLGTMFETVFTNNAEVLSIEEIAFHLLEEIGEVSEALTELYREPPPRVSEEILAVQRQLKVAALAEELADVFSWTMCLLIKVRNFVTGAANYFDKDGRLREVVKGLLTTPIADVEQLIWDNFGRDKQREETPNLVCEGCYQFPCTGKPAQHLGKAAGTLPIPLDDLQRGIIRDYSTLL